MKNRSVYQALNQSNAQLLGEREVQQALQIAFWRNERDLVHYQKDHVHTLSYYTQGGEGSRRVDGSFKRSGLHGAMGRICLLPKGQDSSWDINGCFQFAHLYFSDESVKRFAARELDIEPQTIQIPDLTFHQDAAFAHACQSLFSLPTDASALAYDERIHDVFAQLLPLSSQAGQMRIPKGGLSPTHKHRILDYLHTHWQEPVSLATLAALVDLSEFHLQKMFKQSVGCSPALYQQEIRVQSAKDRLASTLRLGDIAMDCGFANSAHFSRVFRQHVGMTPSEYRKVLTL
jgi:AraC family transcriptional regulator